MKKATKWSDRPVTPTYNDNKNYTVSNNDERDIGEPQQAGSYGKAHWENYGYKMIGQMYHATHDTYVYIGRHKESDKIIVAFRGTSSTKHWKNNFQYGLKEIDFMKMHLPELDEIDNLDSGQYIDLAIHGVDSSESDSSDEDKDDNDGHDDEIPVNRNSTSISGDIEAMKPSYNTARKVKRKRKGKKRASEDHNPVVFVADTVREVGGAVLGATSTVVDATTGLFTAAVAHTPIINKTVKAFVHSGFWECYIIVREFIHKTLRKEMTITSPEKGKDIFFTGHSLGGVLACYAALDFSIHSKDRIDKFNRHEKLRALELCRRGVLTKGHVVHSSRQNIAVAMYSFGAPKPGNWMFSHIYDKMVPNSFRVVVDGDIVCGMPPTMGYQHIGTQVVIDKFCSGSIIVDPSFVERRLRTSTKTSFTAHILALYKRSLEAIREASIYIQHIGVSTSQCDESADGREEFNRAKREVDSESNDLFLLEKIYGLLNKNSEKNVQESNTEFSRLPQESSHSIDESTQPAIIDVSIRGSQWKSSKSYGYDDTFTLNTSEHGDGNSDETEAGGAKPYHEYYNAVSDYPVDFKAEFEDHQLFEDDLTEDDSDVLTPSLTNILSRPAKTLLNVPFYFLKKTTNLIQNVVLGIENIRVNDNQVESMMLLQRSAMQRSDDNDDDGFHHAPIQVQLAPFGGGKNGNIK